LAVAYFFGPPCKSVTTQRSIDADSIGHGGTCSPRLHMFGHGDYRE